MLAPLPGEVGQATWDLRGEDPSWGRSLAEAAAAPGISLKTCMSGTQPFPVALSRDDRGLAVIARCCCCALSMPMMVLTTSTTPLCVLCTVCLCLPILHPQHPSLHPLMASIQPHQAAPCQEAL